MSRELSFEVKKPIDERVDAELKRREEEETAASAPPKEEGDTLPSPDPGLSEEPRVKSSARLPVSLAIGGVGVVGIGVGVAFTIVSSGKKSDADDLRAELEGEDLVCVGEGQDSSCSELSDTSKAVDSTRTVGVIGLAAGGALLVGGVLTYLLWPERSGSALRESSHHTKLLPDVRTSPGGTWTLGVRGSF